ncbi:MAG: NrtA/SsuA/CpmA family ABC transporter substrate-binding protein [Candidatus Sedimenticola sp. (ex Thyasira tokunagai)]
MNKHWRLGGAAIIALVVVILLAAFMRYGREADQQPQHEVTIAVSATPAPGLVFVAYEGGFFNAEGLKVTLQKHSSGKAALGAGLANQAAIAATSENPVIHAAMKGEKVRLFATIMSTDRNYAVVARKDRAITSIAELAGKRVGVTRGTNSEFLLEAMLTINNRPPDSIENVHLAPSDIVDAIVRGEVDAISSWNPHIMKAKNELGDKQLTFYGSELYTATFNLVAMEPFITQNPDVIESVLRAMTQAAKFVRAEPTRAQAMVAKHIKLSAAQFAELWDIFKYDVSLDQALIATRENQARWARAKKSDELSAPLPNFLDFVYLDGLKSVNPKAISIIH